MAVDLAVLVLPSLALAFRFGSVVFLDLPLRQVPWAPLVEPVASPASSPQPAIHEFVSDLRSTP
jgi:hypothetical protein